MMTRRFINEGWQDYRQKVLGRICDAHIRPFENAFQAGAIRVFAEIVGSMANASSPVALLQCLETVEALQQEIVNLIKEAHTVEQKEAS